MMTHRTMTARFSRLAGLFVGAGALLMMVVPADAQQIKTAGAESWQLGLDLPSQTLTALRDGGGLAWDDMRRGGVTVSAHGSGEVSLVMFVLTVDDGEVVDTWTSAPFTAEAGRVQVPGRYLPAVQKARVNGFTAGREPMDAAETIGNNGGGTIFLTKSIRQLGFPRDALRGRGLVMFVVPEGGSWKPGGVMTSPYFLQTEDWSE